MAPTLAAITEDQTTNTGQTVASILGASVTDANAGAVEGIAITGTTQTSGNWEYSLNGGLTWSAVGTVSGTSALLLRETDRVRFLPDALNGGGGTITYRAWDQTSGSVGTKVNPGAGGAATAFSTASDTATIVSTAVNDAPVFTGTAGASYTENAAAVAIVASAAVSDVDAANFNTGSVTVALATYQTGDVLSINNQGSGAGQIGVSGANVQYGGTTIGTFSGGSAANLLISLNANASATAVQALMGQLRYGSSSEDPTVNGTATTRALTVTLSDGGNSGSGGAQTASRSGTITITPLTDAPVIGGAGSTRSYTENAVAVTLESGITVSDADDTQIALGSVTISAGFTAGDTLSFTPQGGITANYNSGTGVLTLSGAASLATYQALLASVGYSSSSDNPTATSSSRTITWSLTDANSDAAGAGTGTATTTVNLTALNDAPTVSAPASFTVTEDVAGNLLYTATPFADPDSATLTVTLSIADGTISASTGGGVTVGGSAIARTFSGTVANLNSFFTTAGSITYTTALDNTSARTLTTLVSDGSLSASTTSTVSITAVNDAPVFTGTAGASYTENAAAVAIVASAAVSDVDAANFNTGSVTVALATYQTGDVLSINNQGSGAGQIGVSGANVQYGGTTIGTFSGGSAANLLISLNANASATAVQALMGQLRYGSSSEDPTVNGTATTRALTVTLSDGGNSGSGGAQTASRSGTITITPLTDAPVIGGAGSTRSYTENAVAVTLESGITVSDADDTQIALGSVTISAGFTAGDTLSFTPQGGITANYNSGTGVLTLSGAASLATYQALLASVGYSSSSDNPTATSSSRTITWSLTDANSDAAGAGTGTATTTVNLTALNDAPTVSAPASFTVTEDVAGNLLYTAHPLRRPRQRHPHRDALDRRRHDQRLHRRRGHRRGQRDRAHLLRHGG